MSICALTAMYSAYAPPSHLVSHMNTIYSICPKSTVCETEDLIADLEVLLNSWAKLLNRSTELYTENFSSLRWNRIMALTLQQIHTIETKGRDLYQS
jgi:hypothetical protein